MVTSYYIMNIAESQRNIDFKEYYRDLKETGGESNDKLCRICLKTGNDSLFNSDNPDLLESLHLLTNIEIKMDDDYPQYLCRVCYNFVECYSLFRKTAQHSEEILKRKHNKTEPEPCQDSFDFGVSNSYVIDVSVERVSNTKKAERKPKLSSKVTCSVCNKIVNRSYYKEHLTMHDPNHQKYVCDICGKSFRLRCAYHNHSLRHRTDFPYKCQFCPYRGRYAELLKTHLRIHTGDYRYMCTECPARFLFKSNLNSHMLKHKDPEFKCDACKRAFHTQLALQRHYDADHLGIKNHVCNICGKAFGYRNAMMKHQRHVHKREKSLFGRMPSYLQAENT